MNLMRLAYGAAIGAGAMYFLDPRQGAKRRARVRDQARSSFERAEVAIGKTARDLSNRAQGVWADTRNLTRHDPVSDDVLVERIRSRMGRLVAEPRAIEVMSTGGRVLLKGSVASADVQPLLRAVKGMQGVHSVDNELDVHSGPGLAWPERENWPPATRFLVGSAGSALALYAMRKSALGRLTFGTLGMSLLAQALQRR